MFKRIIVALVLILAMAVPAYSAKEIKSDAKTPDNPAGKAAVKTSENPVVLFETNMGNIKVELFEKEAPITVKNFISYVNEGFYSGTVFHRVIPNFMIQGGGFNEKLDEKPTKKSIKNEAGNGLKNERGTLAMARTMFVDSATAQFFINVNNNIFLNHRDNSMQGFGYAVFGKVIEGMDVVDKIVSVKTGTRNSMADVPLNPVIIKAARIVK